MRLHTHTYTPRISRPVYHPSVGLGRLSGLGSTPAQIAAYCANNPCVTDPTTGNLIPAAYATEISNQGSTTGATNPNTAAYTPTMQPVNEGQAYWSVQPAAVQALQNLPAGSQARQDLATKLTQQGYCIDTEIGIFGWDPQMTMQSRQAYGYPWVPCWGGTAPNVQPGVTDPGVTSNYDPSNPPARSIPTNLDFVKGTTQNSIITTQQAAAGNPTLAAQLAANTSATTQGTSTGAPPVSGNALNNTAPVKQSIVPAGQTNALVNSAQQTNTSTGVTPQSLANGSGAVASTGSNDIVIGGFDITANWMWLAGGAAALVLLVVMAGKK